MSTLTADPGFARGSVLGILWKPYDAENGDGSNVLGTRKVFLDTDPKTGRLLSNRTVECVCVRNSHSAALLPKQVVRFRITPTSGVAFGGPMAEVVADSDTTNGSGLLLGVVDEYLPSAGVAVGEIFWVVVSGPTVVLKTTVATTGAAPLYRSATAGSVDGTSTTNAQVGFAIDVAATSTTEVRTLVRTSAGF